jgi:hypothetical protein
VKFKSPLTLTLSPNVARETLARQPKLFVFIFTGDEFQTGFRYNGETVRQDELMKKSR